MGALRRFGSVYPQIRGLNAPESIDRTQVHLAATPEPSTRHLSIAWAFVPTSVPFDRQLALTRLATEAFDVLVIGGGVTGCGVALDAAARGLNTALVEAEDFASGTSSKSSKLVHGGLRYLQQHDYRLVYEALHERQRLLANAPHLVHPLPFLIPLFGRDGIVAKSVAKAYSAALWLYDVTGGIRIGKRHRRIDAGEALAHFPAAAHRPPGRRLLVLGRPDRRRPPDPGAGPHGRRPRRHPGQLRASGATHRGRGPPDRGPAGGRHRGASPGGRQRRRRLVRAGRPPGRRRRHQPGVDPSGQGHPPGGAGREAAVRLRRPCWRYRATSGRSSWSRGPPTRSAARRPGPGHFTYIGTTDTDYDGPLDDPQCTAEDIDYVLRAVNAWTTAGLTPDDVTGTLGRAAPARQRRPQRPDRGPLPPPHGHHFRQRSGHRHGREAHHLPADGRRHRGRGRPSSSNRESESLPRGPAGCRWSAPTPWRTGRRPSPPTAAPLPRAVGPEPGHPGATSKAGTASETAAVLALCDGRSDAGRTAGAGTALPAGRGGLGGPPGDGPHPHRRARPAHPGLDPRPGGRRPGRSGRGRPARPRTGLGRGRAGPPGRRIRARRRSGAAIRGRPRPAERGRPPARPSAAP